MLFQSKTPDYIEGDGPVKYLDDSGLKRPFKMPQKAYIVLAAFALVALGVGVWFYQDIKTNITDFMTSSSASVEENLSRDVSYDLPLLTDYIDVDNATIEQQLIDAGYNIYNMSSEEDIANDAMQLMKLPSDVTTADAMLMVANGISSLDASQAALLLNGSWTLNVQHGESTEMRLRYADFTSGDPQAAIDAAMASQGFDPASVLAEGGSGVDEAGNTFMTGTIDAWGYTCTWRVSTIALSDMYSISGLPSDALYVGIRLSY
ncbi:teichoic acid transporter [Eggerthellaceae bacterium 3-80]|nr:teichoic acid transporter [bacterium D16-34]